MDRDPFFCTLYREYDAEEGNQPLELGQEWFITHTSVGFRLPPSNSAVPPSLRYLLIPSTLDHSTWWFMYTID